MADGARRVLVVDDDERFAQTLARSLGRHGYCALIALSGEEALETVRRSVPEAAIVDLRIREDSGLDLIRPLRWLGPGMRIVVLTGYASIATAISAIKLGADDYLPKPVRASALIAALEGQSSAAESPAGADTMSPRRLEWEHIQRVLAEHSGNVSATARALKMHRRTLQRKLAKKPTPE
jgi:two-component system response regulator RegA